MEVKSVKLESDQLNVEFECAYPGMGFHAQTTFNAMEIWDAVRGRVDSEGIGRFNFPVRADHRSVRIALGVYAPAGTSAWVPNGVQFLQHEVDLVKLRKPPAPKKRAPRKKPADSE